MVLLILAGIWAVVLVPPLLRARAESAAADSIVDFRRQLRVLQRTGPSRHSGAGGFPRSQREHRTSHSRGPAGASRGHRSVPKAASPTQAAAKRARTLRRRRDVFFTLLMGMGTTFVLAMVVSSSALWLLQLVMDGLFLAFLAMLVRMRAIATEKEMKLRVLPQRVQPQPAPVLLMRRSATN